MEYMKLLKIKRKNKLIIGIGLLLIVGSLFLWINKQESEKNFLLEEENAIEVFFEEEKEPINNIETKQEVGKTPTVTYIAVLEIPKINFKRGLVDITDPLNNVKYNVEILDETIFPNSSSSSHVILAGHSGNASNAYFNKLHKLGMKDKIFFYYNNVKYIYEITNIYEVDKTGNISLKLTNESDISLITCISGTNKQVVFIATLIEKKDF